MQVLARDLGEGLPAPELPGGQVELVRDERTFRAALAVSVPGWGSVDPDEAEIARMLKQSLQDLATWSSFRVVAIADNEPVSVGGCSLAGAMVGGVLIGLAEALWSAYFDGAYRDVVIFAALITVLVVRPSGLFGRSPQ